MNGHIEPQRLVEHAVGLPPLKLNLDEEYHLRLCEACQTQVREHRSAFQDLTEADLSPAEVQHLRHSFHEAWNEGFLERLARCRVSAAVYLHAARHPLLTVSVLMLATAGMLSAGYWAADSLRPPVVPASALQVVLLPGQRVVDRPEIEGLFPKVDHPTVISTTVAEEPEPREQFMLHGYLQDNQVQVLWQL